MPDLLTHVLVAYTLATLLSIRCEWLTPALVTAVMLGAVVPDLTKIALVVPGQVVEDALGVPFDWSAIHATGGALVAVAAGALLTDSDHRRRVFVLLALGAASHLLLDALLHFPSGYSYPVLWPLTNYHPPALGLYLSSNRWPALVAGVLAVTAHYLQYAVFAPRPE